MQEMSHRYMYINDKVCCSGKASALKSTVHWAGMRSGRTVPAKGLMQWGNMGGSWRTIIFLKRRVIWSFKSIFHWCCFRINDIS